MSLSFHKHGVDVSVATTAHRAHCTVMFHGLPKSKIAIFSLQNTGENPFCGSLEMEGGAQTMYVKEMQVGCDWETFEQNLICNVSTSPAAQLSLPSPMPMRRLSVELFIARHVTVSRTDRWTVIKLT